MRDLRALEAGNRAVMSRGNCQSVETLLVCYRVPEMEGNTSELSFRIPATANGRFSAHV